MGQALGVARQTRLLALGHAELGEERLQRFAFALRQLPLGPDALQDRLRSTARVTRRLRGARGGRETPARILELLAYHVGVRHALLDAGDLRAQLREVAA